MELPTAIPTTKTIRVLLFTGKGARGRGIPALRELLQRKGCVLTEETHVDRLSRDSFDLVIFPGGSGRAQQHALGPVGARKVRAFVAAGGGFVGICAGAFLGSSPSDPSYGLRLLPVPFVAHKLRKEGDDLKGTARLQLHGAGLDWAQSGGPMIDCWYHNGALYPGWGLPKGVEAVATVTQGVGTKWQSSQMKNKATIIRGGHERGRVVLCGPHPEQTEGLEEFTWSMICSVLP